MEFNINKNDFIKVLQRIQGIVEKRNTMPILANVLIEVKDSYVTLIATDLEIYIKDTCQVDVKEEGTVTVNARKLFEIIKQLPDDQVNISVKEGEKLTIKSGRARFNIVGLPSKEFPPFPSIEEDKIVNIGPETLKDMVDKTSFAVSTDETRYNINGFYLEKDDGSIKMVTTDGHRLAMIDKNNKDIFIEEKGVILPRKGVLELRKLLEEKEGSYSFGVTDKSATMKRNDTVVNIRLIEGEFPDYKQVIPKDNDKNVVADRAGLLESLRRVSILSSDKIKGVKFTLSKDVLVLSSSSPDIGDAREELVVEYDGDDLEIAFNAKYFIEALDAVNDEKVELKLKDQLSPGVLMPVEKKGGGYTYIVMPMRL